MGRRGKRKSGSAVKSESKVNRNQESFSDDDTSTLVELINRFNAVYDPCKAQEEVVCELITTAANLLTLTTKTLPSKDQQQQQQQKQLFQVVLMLGRRRLHRIAYTSSSLAVAREVVLRKAFAWLANLSFLVATFKAHYHKSKAAAVVMRPLCLPGLLFVETIQQLQQRPRWSCWSSTLKLIGRRSELKSRGSFQTPKEAEVSVFEQAVAYLKDELKVERIFESFHSAPYVFAAADFNDYDPLNTPATEEYPPMPRMPDHLDSWLGDDI